MLSLSLILYYSRLEDASIQQVLCLFTENATPCKALGMKRKKATVLLRSCLEMNKMMGIQACSRTSRWILSSCYDPHSLKTKSTTVRSAWCLWAPVLGWAGERLTLGPDKQTERVKLKVSQQQRGGRGHILTAVASIPRATLRGAAASKKEGSRSKAAVFWTCLELGITRESNKEAGKIIWNCFSGEPFGKQRCRQSGPWSS